MSNLGLYVVCLGIPLVFGLWTQHASRARSSSVQVPEDTGMTGAEVARRILDANGLQSVPVNAVAGALTDHYDPRTRSVNLSEPVYAAATISSTAVAAHEVGHAIQHAKAYVPMTVRSALWPVTAFASSTWMILLLVGAVLGRAQPRSLVGDRALRRGRAVPDRHAAGRVRRLAPRGGPAEDARHREPRRARRRAQGADVRRADLRRRRARRARRSSSTSH